MKFFFLIKYSRKKFSKRNSCIKDGFRLCVRQALHFWLEKKYGVGFDKGMSEKNIIPILLLLSLSMVFTGIKTEVACFSFFSLSFFHQLEKELNKICNIIFNNLFIFEIKKKLNKRHHIFFGWIFFFVFKSSYYLICFIILLKHIHNFYD